MARIALPPPRCEKPFRLAGRTVCIETGVEAEQGACPEHRGDACLVVLPHELDI